MHERIGASPIFLARPVKPAELVKCVRAILRKELGKHCLAADIARRLGMVRRSLERHLSAEGTTFRKIYRQVLLEASQRLLETGASVSDVAKALGFSEISAFTRAFRRWSGETPSLGSCGTHRRKQSGRARRKDHGELPDREKHAADRSADRAADLRHAQVATSVAWNLLPMVGDCGLFTRVCVLRFDG